MRYTPSRKIKNTGTKKNTGYFPSAKNNRAVCFESLLERDFLYLIEFDNDVIEYYEQPITIKYYINDKKYRYTPDFKVIRNNKVQIIEIKPFEKLQNLLSDERKKQKFINAYYYCKNKGYEFKIVTDNDIRSGYVLKNIKYLFMYSKLDVRASDKLKIKNLIALNEKMSINYLLSSLTINQGERNKYKTYIFNLLYNHVLSCDLSQLLTEESIVRIN